MTKVLVLLGQVWVSVHEALEVVYLKIKHSTYQQIKND